MVAMEYPGLAGTVSTLLGGRGGVSTSPIIIAPFVAMGAAAVGFHTHRWLRLRRD
jgi:hypothetical protein